MKNLLQEILVESIQTVRNQVTPDIAGSLTDHDVMKMHGPIIAALIQSKTALYLSRHSK